MDPLAQLKDIHLPEQIHHYPIAIGWWILATLLVVCTIYAVIKIKQYKQRRQAQKKALRLIEQAQTNHDITSVLKWACLQYFDRNKVAALFSTSFYNFLSDQIPSKYQTTFSQGAKKALLNTYQKAPNELNSTFKEAALLFVTKALPPQRKPKAIKSENSAIMHKSTLSHPSSTSIGKEV